MNKKSQMFSLIAIALIILFFAGYELYSYTLDRTAINRRIRTMDNFLFSLEKNLEREIYITGYRTVFLAEDRIAKTGQYIYNTDNFFSEAFFNGSVAGNSTEIMIGARYSDILQFTNEKASNINVEIDMNNPQIRVYQQDPWNIAVLFSFNLTMKDKGNLASWQRQESIKSLIGIEGFEDPIYIINTNGKLAYKINRTIYTTFAVGSDVSNLNSHVKNRYYAENPDAPSFLNRLEGNLAADVNGIESLADLEEFAKQNIIVQDKSCVDHVYFSSSNPQSYTIQGMPSWFKLDDAHLIKYTS